MYKLSVFIILIFCSSCGALLSSSIPEEKELTKGEKASLSPQSVSTIKNEEHIKSKVLGLENQTDTIKRLEVYE